MHDQQNIKSTERLFIVDSYVYVNNNNINNNDNDNSTGRH